MSATTPKKPAARKPAAGRTTATRRPRAAAAPKPAAELGLVLDDEESTAAVAQLLADREPLFTIAGVTYTIPKRVPPSWSLQAYNKAVEEGESAALAFAAQKCLTEQAWDALVHCETVPPEKMRLVLKALLDKVLPDGVLVPKA